MRVVTRLSYFLIAGVLVLQYVLAFNWSTVWANGAIQIDSCEKLALIGAHDDYPLDDNYVLTKNIDCTPGDTEDSEPGDTLYSEDFEDEADGWTTGGEGSTWHLTEITCEAGGVEFSPFEFESIVYGTNSNAGPECERGHDENSYLMSPVINLPATEIGWVVQFDSWAYDELGGCVVSDNWDSKDIAVTTNEGETAFILNNCFKLHEDEEENTMDFVQHKFSLSKYAGQEIQLMFRYNTGDDCCSFELGWFVDNIVVYEGFIYEPFYGIGNIDNQFQGVFDGQGYSISNLSIQGGGSYAGLFNYLAEEGEVKNLKLLGGEISHHDGGAGSLVGRNYGKITNSHSSMNVEGEEEVGGLVGRNQGEITLSSATGSVYGEDESTGGLVGHNDGGLIDRSWSNNDPGDGDYGVYGGCDVGGLVGDSDEEAVITNSYSRSDVWLDNTSCGGGGLAGYANEAEITNSFSTGAVEADGEAEAMGGLLGNQDSDVTLNFLFWDVQTSDLGSACGLTHEESDDCFAPENAQGKNTVQMKNLATFTAELGADSWDFGEVWDINGFTNAGYPFIAGFGDSPNKKSLVNPETGKTVILELVGDDCEITEFSAVSEASLSVQDAGFDYGNGLVNFTAECTAPTVTVKLYYYGVSKDNLVVRKHNPALNAFFNVPGSTLEQTTINSQTVTIASYEITDNGILDLNNDTGVITDPVGLGASILGVPNTGLGARKD